MFKPTESNQSPFAMVAYFEERDNVQKRLAERGVYSQLLWPLKAKAKDICPVSKYLEEHMLAIPIDQRYDYYDIQEMGTIMKEVLK